MDYFRLIRSPLFRGMTPDIVKSILEVTPNRIRKYQPGSVVALAGEPVSSFLMVAEGSVKGEMVDFAGRVIKIEDIPAPGAIASAFIFGNRNQYPVNVITISATELLVIEKSDFLRLLMKNDKLLVNFLDMISNRSQFLSDKIKFLNFKTIKGKLAQLIMQKAGNESNTLTLDMTQNELAEFFGVARPSIARALGELEDEGYLQAKGRNIIISDRERLKGLTLD